MHVFRFCCPGGAGDAVVICLDETLFEPMEAKPFACRALKGFCGVTSGAEGLEMRSQQRNCKIWKEMEIFCKL
jgi:hypothetical protein